MKATDYFRVIGGYNCAQAILLAFKDEFNVDDKTIKEFSKFGGGKADEGLCGALYAVNYLLKDEKLIQKANHLFKEKAGSIICKEIRKLKIYSCKNCVELAEEILQKLKNI